MRLAGTWTSIATTMLIGLVLVAPFALASDLPHPPLRSWASAQAEEGLGVVWTLTASRITAVALLVPVALVLGSLRLPRKGIPFAVGMAALDLGGYAAFLAGAPVSVAITSVLASQYAIVAVAGGFLVLGERLSSLQTGGIAITVAGVAALAALRA